MTLLRGRPHHWILNSSRATCSGLMKTKSSTTRCRKSGTFTLSFQSRITVLRSRAWRICCSWISGSAALIFTTRSRRRQGCSWRRKLHTNSLMGRRSRPTSWTTTAKWKSCRLWSTTSSKYSRRHPQWSSGSGTRSSRVNTGTRSTYKKCSSKYIATIFTSLNLKRSYRCRIRRSTIGSMSDSRLILMTGHWHKDLLTLPS